MNCGTAGIQRTRRTQTRPRSAPRSERKLRTEAALELGNLPERLQLWPVFVPSERPEHARQVAGRGDRRAKSPSQRLPGRGAAEVVVTPRPLRLGHDLELAGAARGADQGIGSLVEFGGFGSLALTMR